MLDIYSAIINWKPVLFYKDLFCKGLFSGSQQTELPMVPPVTSSDGPGRNTNFLFNQKSDAASDTFVLGTPVRDQLDKTGENICTKHPPSQAAPAFTAGVISVGAISPTAGSAMQMEYVVHSTVRCHGY